MRFRRAVVVAATVAATTALIGGCSGRRSPGAGPATSNPAAPAPSTVAPPATTGPATSSGATSTAPMSSTAPPSNATGTTHCTTGSLSLSLADLGAAAGTAYRELIFTNTSSRPCTMQGYPGVSFLDSHGGQIGAPVPRKGGTAGAVALAPGGMAAAVLSYNDAFVATSQDCRPTAAAAIQAYPPDQTAALTVATNLMVCANKAATGTALIAPVTAAAGVHP